MSPAVLLVQIGIGRQARVQLLHQPGRLEADAIVHGPGTAQVVQRGKRRDIGEARRRLDHVGQPTRAAVGDRAGAPAAAAELRLDGGEVLFEAHLPLAASTLDHSLPYLGLGPLPPLGPGAPAASACPAAGSTTTYC